MLTWRAYETARPLVTIRDLMMAGTQQSVELKLALDQEQQKSKKLEDSMKKLDEEMKRTDELLYQMIPKLVADRLRKGENPVDTCQVNKHKRAGRGWHGYFTSLPLLLLGEKKERGLPVAEIMRN